TDPSMDLDGWDSTVKACLVANVLMGGRLRPERVPRQGVSSIPADAVRTAGAEGKRVKQVARGWREGRTVRASVSIKAIGPDHPLFAVNGTSSSLVVRTDMLKEFQIIERDPALRQTAFEGGPERVLIGLTTDRFARESRSRVNPYATRERNLKRFLAARKWRPAKIVPIDDPYGPADDLPDLDVIVVSAERHPVAIALN